MKPVVEAALNRHRAVSIGALALLAVMAWVWLIAGAGTGMEPHLSLAPLAGGAVRRSSMAIGGAATWTTGRFAQIFAMWWVMMVAMMLPSAAPMILLFDRISAKAQLDVPPGTATFLAGYLLIWASFSLVAAGLQLTLEQSGMFEPMMMASRSRWLSALVPFLAGIYQLTPVKDLCLRQCSNPARFLSLHYRPGQIGALRMGLMHGAYCVGCCWLLMMLLFVGGVMNLAWIALLTVMVAAEKLLPFGRRLSVATGWACIGWAAMALAA